MNASNINQLTKNIQAQIKSKKKPVAMPKPLVFVNQTLMNVLQKSQVMCRSPGVKEPNLRSAKSKAEYQQMILEIHPVSSCRSHKERFALFKLLDGYESKDKKPQTFRFLSQ